MFHFRSIPSISVLFAVLLAAPFALGAEAQTRTTDFPPSAHPDDICLTWSDDPCTTQTVQWRTSPDAKDGCVQYRKSDAPESETAEIPAEGVTLEDPLVTNAPAVHHFTATLKKLTPGTTYQYRVGGRQGEEWSAWAPFTTAPKSAGPFSFLFFADVQNGLEDWGKMIHQMLEKNPKAAFCLTGGDFVNHGNDRTDWDELFHYAAGVFDRCSILPTIGNHECNGGPGPKLYLDLFALPENGPKDMPKERAYSFRYGNALFIVLDGNTLPAKQADWLDKQLSKSKATWKFVAFHQPAYSSDPGRDNRGERENWCSLFDKYHVDMVFQGHDHAYLRTHPMKAEKIVGSPAEGTIYVVADGGAKYYKQEEHDYTAVGFTNVSTYQVVNIDTEGGDTLTYRAYDANGKVRDEVLISKN